MQVWSLGQKIPWSRKGQPTPHSWLENSMDRGVWHATVHGVTKSWARLSTHTCVGYPFSRALPNPGIKPGSPALQAHSLPAEPQGKPCVSYSGNKRNVLITLRSSFLIFYLPFIVWVFFWNQEASVACGPWVCLQLPWTFHLTNFSLSWILPVLLSWPWILCTPSLGTPNS